MKNYIILVAILLTSFIVSAQPRGEQAVFNATSNSYIDYGKGIDLNGYDSINGGKKMSITLWMKWDNKSASGVGSWANIFTLNNSVTNGDNGVFWIQHSQDNDKIEFALMTKDGNRRFIQSTTNPQAGVWYHVACVFDGTLNADNMKLYVNGTLEAKATTQTSNNINHNSRKINSFTNVSKLYAGRWAFSSSTRNFNGLLDELSIWSSALTAAEIASISSNPESITGVLYDAAKLVGYYNFDNGNTNDLTNNNNGVAGTGLTYTNNSSLPVELIGFDAKNINGNIIVEWVTATEVNNNFFTVERSIDGFNAEVIGVVSGSGNSNAILNYQFEDLHPVSGIAYYRIKQTDYDGTTEVFPWKAVEVVERIKSELSVFPNPTSGNISVLLSNTNQGVYTIKVIDVVGKIVYLQNENSENNVFASFTLPSGLTSGVYFVEVNNNVDRFIQKIILR